MNKVEELITKLCPNGANFKKLTEIVNFRNGKGHEKNIENFGKYIVVNSKYISTNGKVKKYTNKQISPLFNEEILMVMSDLPNGKALAKCFIVDSDNKYTLNQRICALDIKDKKKLNYKFLYYVLNRNVQLLRYDNKVDQTNLKKGQILNISIPVPPIEIQNEIVQILDSFIELKEELEEELEARKKQYEYYRDLLLNSNKYRSLQTQVYRLDEISEIYDGTHQTPKYKNEGIPFISVENIDNIYDSKKYISIEDYTKYKIKPKVGDVFMTRIGSIGRCAVFNKQEDIAYYVSLALIRPNQKIINSYYLKYLLESIVGKTELRKRTLVNAVPIKINKVDIGKIKLPIPSIEIQEKIVRVLNRFDRICNDISEGIPAEMEARRKQYEYYRDKLLSFKENKNG